MTTRFILLCPGQGAQAVGMGRAWAQASPASRACLDEADAVLGTIQGTRLSALCFDGPAEILNRTDVSQPAIFACSVASWRGMLEKGSLSPSDVHIAGCAGLSLGEYTALHLAGSIGFADALRLVALRGRAMQDAAEAKPSGMVALIGATPEQAAEVCDAARGPDVLVCANFNAPGQVVISGSKAACARAEAAASERGLRAQALAVAGAFHSPIMAPAAERLREALRRVEVGEPRCPVMSNVTGAPHETGPDAIRTRLVEQLTSPVRWEANCRAMLSGWTGEFLELAPGRTLAGMMKRIDRAFKVSSLDVPQE